MVICGVIVSPLLVGIGGVLYYGGVFFNIETFVGLIVSVFFLFLLAISSPIFYCFGYAVRWEYMLLYYCFLFAVFCEVVRFFTKQRKRTKA